MTLVGGIAMVMLSIVFPQLVAPFSHGVPGPGLTEGWGEVFTALANFQIGDVLGGAKSYKFTRAFYGLSVSVVLGVVTTLVTTPKSKEEMKGLVWGTISDAIERYKGATRQREGGRVCHRYHRSQRAGHARGGDLRADGADLAWARGQARRRGRAICSMSPMRGAGSVVCGRPTHKVVEVSDELEGDAVEIGPETHETIIARRREGKPVRVQKLYE